MVLLHRMAGKFGGEFNLADWPGQENRQIFVQTIESVPRGGSAGIRILYTYVTSSGDIRYDNRSYAVLVQR